MLKMWLMNCPTCDSQVWLIEGDAYDLANIKHSPEGSSHQVHVDLDLHVCNQKSEEE